MYKRQVVYGAATGAMSQSFVVFDLETTGLSPADYAITEIGAGVVENGEITESYNSFVNPGCHIPEEITKITNTVSYTHLSSNKEKRRDDYERRDKDL